MSPTILLAGAIGFALGVGATVLALIAPLGQNRVWK